MTPQQHLCPKPLEIAERCRFYKQNQQERETVLAYAADLKKLATHFNFGANLKEALRDKFVCGLQKCADTNAFSFRSKTEIFQGFRDSRNNENCHS